MGRKRSRGAIARLDKAEWSMRAGEDPPGRIMELVRGDQKEMELYEYYVKRLLEDVDFNLNLVEAHRLAVLFVLVDRFKSWELAMGKEDWVSFLGKNYGVAELVRKYEQYAMTYLQKAKLDERRPVSVFDQVQSVLAEFKGDGGELKVEWKGAKVIDAEAEVIEDAGTDT